MPEGAQPVRNPAKHTEIVGYHTHHNKDDMLAMIDKAETAFTTWSKTPVLERSALLCRIADTIEQHMDEFIALCIKSIAFWKVAKTITFSPACTILSSCIISNSNFALLLIRE